jgi:steroid 5-alpha reductase family enzyme
VVLAYLAALSGATASLWLMSSIDLLWSTALADLVATCVVFAFSVGANNSSIYDAFWSVAPLGITGYWAAHPAAQGDPVRTVVVVALVVVWGCRLTYNWWRGWRGLEHEDWRYAAMRPRSGRAYWLVSLAGFHLFPTTVVFLGCLPLWCALVVGTRPFGWLDAVGAGVTMSSIVVEAVADRQLARHRGAVAAARARGETIEHPLLTEGLWAWSRHPNYLGELGFWAGLFIIGLAAQPTSWWTFAGLVAMGLLFTLVSVPLIENRLRATRPQYADYAARVPAILPRLRPR